MLSEYPLNPLELFHREFKTIQIIRSTAKMQELSNVIYSDSDNAMHKMPVIKKPKDFKKHISTELLNFDSWIKSEDEKYKIFFGGKITLHKSKTEFEHITYYFAVFDLKKNTLIRKFHFDFCTGKSDKSQKPFYHIQYAGRLNQYLINELNINDSEREAIEESLASDCDLPRIPYMPMSFIQLVSLIIKEFCPSKAAGIINGNWYGHLKESEQKLCERFHEKCVKTIRIDNKSLLMNCFY
ncbi:MAG: hypothetical protein WC955_07535 [Elusimicrobiota bacterium]